MSARLRSRARLSYAIACVTLAAAPLVVQAQGSSNEAQDASEPVEEVVVRGQRGLRNLYNEAGRATERFYGLLNEYLDDEEMRVTCRLENRRNSRMRERVCRTGFQSTELSRQGQAQVAALVAADGDLNAFMGTAYDPRPELAEKQREFNAKVVEAVNSNPELNRAVLDLMAIKREIERREGRDGR